jgi:hypothetical protein
MLNTTTKITQNISDCISSEKNVSGASLDTLAQLAKNPLLKRARSKYISGALSLKLADLQSELRQSYFNTYHCADTLTQSGKKVISKYCGNRWCLTCNRIRTAKLIMGYREPLSALIDPQFVTLTIPNVAGRELATTIRVMQKTFRKIQKLFEKRKTPIIGIRKIEVTFNARTGEFHPHFHLVVSGHQIAQKIVLEWLKRFPKANNKAQDIRPADDNSIMELFKYFTKVVSGGVIYTKALDTIFDSMKGERLVRCYNWRKHDRICTFRKR